jgi:GNAT superfamily N-acetyltransferase
MDEMNDPDSIPQHFSMTSLPQSRIQIEPVTGATAPDFLRLVDGLADYEKLPRPTDEAKQRLIRDCTGDRRRIEAHLAWIQAPEGRRAVGYIILLETYSSFLALPTLFIEDIYVEPGTRGAGAGRALFAHAVAEARRRQCGRVEFLVLDWNRLARDFYERAGAFHLRDWVAYRINSDDFDLVLSGLNTGTGPAKV